MIGELGRQGAALPFTQTPRSDLKTLQSQAACKQAVWL